MTGLGEKGEPRGEREECEDAQQELRAPRNSHLAPLEMLLPGSLEGDEEADPKGGKLRSVGWRPERNEGRGAQLGGDRCLHPRAPRQEAFSLWP